MTTQGGSYRITIDPGRIDTLFQAFDQTDHPGCAVGIALHGEPVYRRGFGLATTELPVSMTPSIRTRIGSTSKHFACLAFMLLVEDGRAELDTPIGRYLSELSSPVADIPMRALMSHTGGALDAFEVVMQYLPNFGNVLASSDLAKLTAQVNTLQFKTGESWSYNNSAYVLLTAVIEKLSGEKLEDVLRKRIFEPAGMLDTELRRRDHVYASNVATQHLPDGMGHFVRSPGFRSEIAGEGGIIATVDDMLRWLRHMSAPVVGSASTWQAMQAATVLPNGVDTHYGLGLFNETYRGVRVISHAGGVIGGGCDMARLPDLGLDIFITFNYSGAPLAPTLTRAIIDTCIEGLDPMEACAPGKSFSGLFFPEGIDHPVSIVEEDGVLLIDLTSMKVPALWNQSGHIYHPFLFGTSIQPPSPDAPDAIVVNEFGHKTVMRHLPKAPQSPSMIAGRYRLASWDAHVTIHEEGDHAVMVVDHAQWGRSMHRLQSHGAGWWHAVPTSDALQTPKWLLFAQDHQTAWGISPRARGVTLRREN
ncbi:serine hydrolase domain-containing protein [Gluconacetobacter sp. Hr-1-5]|uniref:serine hydrolase domain-containing protein n=1 Tax=Gluconacetobacter sp. Hr-1-5 TaxID=3395370 RepID=UPI003B517D5E